MKKIDIPTAVEYLLFAQFKKEVPKYHTPAAMTFNEWTENRKLQLKESIKLEEQKKCMVSDSVDITKSGFNSHKSKEEQKEWLASQGFKPGDILQQGCYPIMKIHWYKEYKMYGLICKSWECFHFFGDLYDPEKCKKYEKEVKCQ